MQPNSPAAPSPVLVAFRRRFTRNPEVATLTQFGFFEAGWHARGWHELRKHLVPRTNTPPPAMLPPGACDRLSASAAAELAEHELHDLRATMVSIDEAVHGMQEGGWDVARFAQWWQARTAEHEHTLLARFKAALRKG